MKLSQTILLILLPICLLSQEGNRFEITDSIINVNEILREKFGNERINQLEQLSSINSPYYGGILELDNILQKEKNIEQEEIPGSCQCQIMKGKLEIANAIGFMAGILNIIEVNLSDSTYQSKIYYITDGAKTHKFKPEEDFIQDIEVRLETSRLEISPDSEFNNHGILKGKLVGTSIKYCEKDNSKTGYREIQTKILSIFECKIEDYDQMMIEMEEIKKAQEKKKAEKENKNKN